MAKYRILKREYPNGQYSEEELYELYQKITK